MRAIDLFEMAIRENQKEILLSAVPEKRNYVLSEEFFNILKGSALEQGYAEVTPTLMKVVEGHDSPNALKVLEQEVKEGFWIYSYACSVNYHEFRWYLNEKEALKIYNSMKVAYFMTRKYLIHSEKGVLLKQVIK